MAEYTPLSIKELREKLQRTAPEGESETLVGQTVRFFSIYFTKVLARTSITPNQITLISMVFFFSGLGVFLFQTLSMNLLGVLLIYVSIVFDACDGEIARLKGNNSGIGGVYVEPLSHDIQYALMFIPLSLAAYMSTGDVSIVYVGFVATVAKLLYRFLLIRFEYVMKEKSGQRSDTGILHKENNVSVLHSAYRFLNRNIFSSVGLVIPLLASVLIDRVDLFLWLFCIGFVLIFLVNFIRQMLYIVRM